jgi:hypothetical protein
MLQLQIKQAEETEMNNNFLHLCNMFLCGSPFKKTARRLKPAKAHVDNLQALERQFLEKTHAHTKTTK